MNTNQRNNSTRETKITTPTYFIKGDVSGIQEFIFNVKSEKAARVLKARSVFVEILAQITLKYLKSKFQVTTNDYFEGGGSFYLAIKHNNLDFTQIKTIVKDSIEPTINELAVPFDLYVVLSVVKDSNYWESLAQQSEIDKLGKFSYAFGDTNVFENVFAPYAAAEKDNHDWLGFAHELVKQKIEGRQLDNNEATNLKIFEKGMESLNTKIQFIGKANTALREVNSKDFFYKRIQNKLPEWNNSIYDSYKEKIKQELEQRNRYNEEIETIRRNDIIDFYFLAEFAKERTGTAKLGVLKMDVDDLGKLFRDQTDFNEIKKISKLLSKFFEEELYQLLKHNIEDDKLQYNSTKPTRYIDNIYTVFAGGDDSFFVGSWDVIFKWALKVQKAFEKFAKDNRITHKKDGKYPTLSAGLIVVGAKYPVAQFAELVEEAIDEAKYKNNNQTYKNKVCVFGQVLTWEEYKLAMTKANDLATLINKDENTSEKRSLLERIKRSAIGYEKLQEKALNDDFIAPPKVARLFYYLGRREIENDIITKLINAYAEALIKAFSNKQATNPMVFPVAARWAEFLTRKTN